MTPQIKCINIFTEDAGAQPAASSYKRGEKNGKAAGAAWGADKRRKQWGNLIGR